MDTSGIGCPPRPSVLADDCLQCVFELFGCVVSQLSGDAGHPACLLQRVEAIGAYLL